MDVLTEVEIQEEISNYAQQLIENMPFDTEFSIAELKARVGNEVFYGGFGLCLKNGWVVKRGNVVFKAA